MPNEVARLERDFKRMRREVGKLSNLVKYLLTKEYTGALKPVKLYRVGGDVLHCVEPDVDVSQRPADEEIFYVLMPPALRVSSAISLQANFGVEVRLRHTNADGDRFGFSSGITRTLILDSFVSSVPVVEHQTIFPAYTHGDIIYTFAVPAEEGIKEFPGFEEAVTKEELDKEEKVAATLLDVNIDGRVWGASEFCGV